MPASWEEALNAYNYPVNLADFADAYKYPGFFKHNIEGDLQTTREFQDRFRENAPYHLEAWYEVVYWKYYFMPNRHQRNGATRNIIRNIRQSGVAAKELWELCHTFTENGKFDDFKGFRDKVVSPDGTAIIVPATFPAFLDPGRFPMVDTHVTNWARNNGFRHRYTLPDGHILSLSGGVNLTKRQVPLTEKWKFMVSWIRWCRFTSTTLSQLSGQDWNARDVEMAVFTVQRSKRSFRTLNPLCENATTEDNFEII